MPSCHRYQHDECHIVPDSWTSWCTHTHCLSLIVNPGIPAACGAWFLLKCGSKEKWHRDCSMWNLTISWTSKSKRTLPGFQRSFTRPQMVDGLDIAIFEWWPVLLDTAFLDTLQRQKKNKIWGYSGWILPLRWILKCWQTLPAFHWLLIQPYPTNGLDVMEFGVSTPLLKSVWDRTAAIEKLNSED
jgi:hypothetical protein